ncbi:MAG: signal peptidase II [Acidobacteria bacterium]|nr:signal peptidase II [Acidobacteriota bacterium]
MSEIGFERKTNAFIIAVIVTLSDWGSKYLIHSHFTYGAGRPVIAKFFNLVHVRNFGSAFGLMNQGKATSFNTWFFAFASLLGLFLLLYLLYNEYSSHRFAIVCLGLLMGGVIGNQGERFLHGYVTDFLDFYVNAHHWPAFNIADSAITIGIIGYFLASLRKRS